MEQLYIVIDGEDTKTKQKYNQTNRFKINLLYFRYTKKYRQQFVFNF